MFIRGYPHLPSKGLRVLYRKLRASLPISLLGKLYPPEEPEGQKT